MLIKTVKLHVPASIEFLKSLSVKLWENRNDDNLSNLMD